MQKKVDNQKMAESTWQKIFKGNDKSLGNTFKFNFIYYTELTKTRNL